jgi:putative heme iron utilization protein
MSHINVTDMGAIVREEYTTRGLHNFRGKMKLTHLTAESIAAIAYPEHSFQTQVSLS